MSLYCLIMGDTFLFLCSEKRRKRKDMKIVRVMRDIMQKYHIPCDTSLEDWRTDLWRCGYSGDVAINNLSVYMVEALTRAGYSNS